MARKTGQIICRGPSTWLVRVYVGRDSGNPETQVYRQIHSWRAAVHTGSPQPQARTKAPQQPSQSLS